MESETSGEILQEIDRILTAIGQTDYEALQVAMQKASILLGNLGRLCGEGASMGRDDIVALIHQKSEPEQQRILMLLYGLRESLPKLGGVLVKAAQFLPPDEGGRPKSFENRETMRQACNMVLDRIAKGDSEAQAKRFAAKKFKTSYQTMHRTWEKRREIMEQSFEEFITPILKSLSMAGGTAIPQTSSLMKPPEESTKHAPFDDKIEDK